MSGQWNMGGQFRLLIDGGVSIDGQKILDFKAEIACQSGMVIKVGKHRIYKLA